MNRIITHIILLAILSVMVSCTHNHQKMVLAKDGRARVVIVLPNDPSVTLQFAGKELSRYLEQISGARFTIEQNHNQDNPAIELKQKEGTNPDHYEIAVQNGHIILSGHSGRAVLYAVYDFLGRLGCQWPAPDFSFYKGKAGIIPEKSYLIYHPSDKVSEQPDFAWRKLDVAGSRTHETEPFKQLIDWMPKVRYNTLRFAMDRDSNSRAKWNKFRKALTPELEKRGIIIEVGGHGYQHFLNARMEDNTLFKKHPEWFGKDSACNPSRSNRLAFNTSNSEAVDYFINNVVAFIKRHPEIDIFDLWPPDAGRWADCPDMDRLGSAADRQAHLANQVDSALKKIRPDIRLEIIAYSHALLPPEKGLLHKDIQVEICPINQQFEGQINNPAFSNNAEYVSAIRDWRETFKGSLGLYSYYRKQAWRSLPNIIPHYIQSDMQWYKKASLEGISCYAEPGDWFTYELNQYILARVAWNTEVNIDSLISQFCRDRYGKAWEKARSSYALLEQTVRKYGSIPFTTLKSKEQIKQVRTKVDQQISMLQKEKQEAADPVASANLSRLLLMFQYFKKDLAIQQARTEHASKEILYRQVKELLAFLQSNQNKGVFILTGKHDLLRFEKHYGLTKQSLLGL